MNAHMNRSWSEIDLDAIAHNIKAIRRHIGKHAEIMAVVKADAYGHGVMETCRTMIDSGATRLAVSMLDEAVQLRRSGIEVPIMVLGYSDPGRADEILTHSITQTVFSHDLADALSEASQRMHIPARIHIKIDTGMTRVGFMPGYAAIKDVVRISALPGIVVEGIFTHFSSADEEDRIYTMKQYELFESMMQELSRIGLNVPIRHVANSAAVMQYPEMAMEMVRPGVILYGLYPSGWLRGNILDLKPAMAIKANVILVKDVEAGVAISYSRRFVTQRASRIATIPIGYADGYLRAFSNKGRVLIGGEFAPVVGAICMDQCMVDITDLSKPVQVGDEVVLMGSQGNQEISAEEWADICGTISYETICLVGKRVPRIYKRDNIVVNICNYLL